MHDRETLEDDVDCRSMAPGAKMGTALRASSLSPNRVRRVGAVLVAGDGTEIAACNTFPAGVRDLEERHEGDGRFVWMEHAERGAIFEAARRGIATAGGRLATTFFPCIDCAPAFVDPVWGASFERSQVILREGGVEVRIVDIGAVSE